MNCAVCGGETKVTNTAKDCDAVYRVRKCKECGELLYTCEQETDDIYYVKDLLNARFRTSKHLKGKKEA